MRVLIDARSIETRLSGVGRHALNLLLGLSHVDSELEFHVLYTDPKARKVVSRAGGQHRNRFQWVQSSLRGTSFLGAAGRRLANLEVPLIARAHRARLFHDLACTGAWIPKVPRISTVHELDGLYSGDVESYRESMRKRLKGAACIVAVSRAVAGDIESRLHFSMSKIRVIANAIDPWYVERASVEEIRAMRERFKIPGRYFLCVTSESRVSKNSGLVTALAKERGKRALGQASIQPDKFIFTLPSEGRDAGPNAVFLDVVDDVWLRPLYAESTAVIVPSAYEGFSLPPIEALASGSVPVVSSIPAHRELLSGVLPEELFFEPSSVQSLEKALQCVLDGGQPLRMAMVEKFRALRDRYSFIEIAKKTHALYRETLRT
ncbi:MAG: glycosyltransferase [Deltaproteobacteria bacterium]|nr:glycosyltransferase [Deltaproteobacteria bacterium]